MHLIQRYSFDLTSSAVLCESPLLYHNLLYYALHNTYPFRYNAVLGESPIFQRDSPILAKIR
jgi:hypothetical protein